jgi:polar amino acid transport system substrate-binding protein
VVILCCCVLAGGFAFAEEPVTQILAANSGSPRPYAFYDENNEVAGYEIDVINAIDELLPQYSIKLEQTEFASIFAGVDAGRYQLGANNLTKKPEREEKYLFANEYYAYNYTVAVVKKGRADITTLEDLGGKKVYVSDSGGFAQLFFDNYNAEHPDNPVITIYSSADTIKQYQDIVFGTIDFVFTETVIINEYFEEYPELEEGLEYVFFSQEETQRIQDPYAWYIYPKTEDGEKLRDAVDDAILQLVESGKLKELSENWFGFDATGR